MAGGTNSLDGLLKEILRREKNSIELIQKFSDSLTTTDESLIVEYETDDGTIETIQIPSYGYILSRLRLLENNQDAISGTNLRNVTLIGSDGIRRSLIISEVPLPKNPGSSLSISSNFETRLNKPLKSSRFPQTVFNIQVDYLDNVSEYLVRKYSLNINTEDDLLYFNENLLGRNDITIEEINTNLPSNNISYEITENRIQTDYVQANTDDKFSVMSFRKESGKVYYRFESINYLENSSQRILEIGNRLVIDYNEEKTTFYEIVDIDTSTNDVVLNLIEGYDPIRIGTDIFGLYQSVTKTKIPIEITKNEYLLVFIKPITNNFQLVSRNWGTGISVVSSSLTLGDENLDDYTDNNVTEYEKDFLEIIKNPLKTITSEQEIPPSPSLTTDSLSTVIANRHKQGTQNDEIRKKNNEKSRLREQINSLSNQISALKTKISTTQYDTTEELEKDRTSLNTKRSQLNSLESDYSALVRDMNTIIDDLENFSPKYRIEGFIPIPTSTNEIIGFRVQYRYLKINGGAIQAEQYEYQNESENTQKASKSKWLSFETPIKTRQIVNNSVKWVEINQNDPDELSINELSIPITQNEQVEIRVKTLSEIGYPTPLESDWSSSVIIPFDNEILSETPVIDDSNLIESIKNDLNQDLISSGVYEHVSETTNVLGKTYNHFSQNIGTSEIIDNRPKTLEEKLLELDTTINDLRSIVLSSIPEMSINILDQNNNVISRVSNNSDINIFGGYYVDEIESLPIKKGQIITKIYYIEISNLSESSDLELLSYVPGINEKLPVVDLDLGIDYDGYLINKDEYRLYRKYWDTPISFRNIANNDILLNKYNIANEPYINIPSYQSSQTKGQFVFARNRDLSLGDSLYIKPAMGADDFFLPSFSNVGNGTRSYVWNGDSLGSGNGNLTPFSVHINHPELQSGSTFLSNYNDLFSTYTFNSNGLLVRGLPAITNNNTQLYYPFFSHAKYFNLDETKQDYYKQLSYRQIQKNTSGTPTEINFQRKIGFINNDQYLIGSNTCGSYLFIAPQDEKQITVGSATYNATKIIKNGDSFKIRIPIVYQSRFTDYDGDGDSGNGNLGGIQNNQNSNLVYNKKIGIDINQKNQEIFSFDLSISMKYKRDSLDSTII